MLTIIGGTYMMQELNLTEGQMAVLLFEKWMGMLVEGKIPDCKRYHDEFFEYYKGQVKSEKAPFYLMFCAFIGAMDLDDKLKENENR